MSTIQEAAALIRASDAFEEERRKTIHFATKIAPSRVIPLLPLDKGTLDAHFEGLSWSPHKFLAWDNDYVVQQIMEDDWGRQYNIGALFFDQLVDIDIDTTDPLIIAAMEYYLADTPTVFKWGRASKPISHMAYILAEPFDRKAHARAIKALASAPDLRLEVRGGEFKSNFFTMMPGSIHSTGELVRWHKDYDMTRTVAPVADVSALLWRLRRASAAALLARHASAGNRHFYFMAVAGILVRLWQQAEDGGNPHAMDKEQSWNFIQLVRKLADDDSKDDPTRRTTFEKTWDKFVDDPTIPLRGGKALAEEIGAGGQEVRNFLYRLLVDDEGFEIAEEALERFILMPRDGEYYDLNMFKPWEAVPGALNEKKMNAAFTNVRVPFGEKMVPVPLFLKNSSFTKRARGIELRPEFEGRTFKVNRGSKHHGMDDEALYINAWCGFEYAASERSVDPSEVQIFTDYVFEVLASKDPERYEWIMAWAADIFQDPANKPETLLCLTGAQGSGKTMFGEILGRMIGPAHYGKVGSIEDLTKEFNSRVHYKLLVQADETSGSQRTAISRDLKELVSGKTQQIVYKGKEAVNSNNPARYFFTSNNSGDALRVEAGHERRYTILEVSSVRVGNFEFWAALDGWARDPDNLCKLLRFFKDYKYDKAKIRRALGTKEKVEHQMLTLPYEAQWLLARATEGHPLGVETHLHSYQAFKADVSPHNVRNADGTVKPTHKISPPPSMPDRLHWPNVVDMASLQYDYLFWIKANNIRAAHSANGVPKLLRIINGNEDLSSHKATVRRDGIPMRVTLRGFPSRAEVIEGLCTMYPALADTIRARTQEGVDTEIEYEEGTEQEF